MGNKFWEKVDKCKHTNLVPHYYEYVSCPTPECGGSEVRCNDCNVFITKCGCGYNNGMSGWPEKRWRKNKYI
jgi:hypothetical protein